MPAVGRGVPGTSTGVIETDSVFTQRSVTHSKSGWTVLSSCDSHLVPDTNSIQCAYRSANSATFARIGTTVLYLSMWYFIGFHLH